MGLSIKTSGDLIAVGRLAQAGPETAALMDGPDNGALILFNEDSSIDIVKERDDDQDEKTGQVEATDIDTLSLSAAGTLTQDKATPDGLAWMSSFFCNFSQEDALGSGVFRHSARMGSYPDEAMYFTAAHRRGGSAADGPADFRRQVGLGVNTFNITANKGEFLQAGVGILGLGLFDDAIFTEVFLGVTATGTVDVVLTEDLERDDFASATAYGVEPAAAPSVTGLQPLELVPTAYVNATNTLTLNNPTAATPLDITVTYPVDASDADYFDNDWRTSVEALAVQQEFKLKSTNIQLILQRELTSFAAGLVTAAGQVALCEIESLEYTGDWQGEAGRCWRTGATASERAIQVELGDMRQTVTVNRQVRDYMFKQNFDQDTPMSIYMDAIGPPIPGGGGPDFKFSMIIPKVKFLEKPYQVSDGKWIEAGSFLVLKETNPTPLPTVIFETINQVPNYVE